MTTTPKVSRERADRAIAFFSEKLKDLLADDRRAAKEDDPNGMVHPIYMGKLIGPIYRDAISILSDYAARQDKEDKAPPQRKVTREWIEKWAELFRVGMYPSERVGVEYSIQAMLRELGISVDDGQEKGREG